MLSMYQYFIHEFCFYIMYAKDRLVYNITWELGDFASVCYLDTLCIVCMRLYIYKYILLHRLYQGVIIIHTSFTPFYIIYILRDESTRFQSAVRHTIRKNNLPFSSYCISYLQDCYIITYSEVCSFIVAHTEVYEL